MSEVKYLPGGKTGKMLNIEIPEKYFNELDKGCSFNINFDSTLGINILDNIEII